MIKVGNNYELYLDKDHFLGRGSFSRVYLGKYVGESNHIKYGTDVAIKIINTDTIINKSHNITSIIEDEIKIMEIIKKDPHPNIVECYDIIRDKSNNTIYIIMEYCDSKDLRTIIKKPIKESYTQFYFSQLANGLKYLDAKNIMHRDIKPKNILLTNSRRVLKIADFGFARQTRKDDLHETVCGSPLYMAPEITSSTSYNRQTDLWSIGMILYEMLYGYHPFHKCKNIHELKYSMENIEISIPPEENTNKDVSPECIHLLKQLLQKNVRHRITWDDFFNNHWINKYQYININTNKKNEEYEDQLSTTSLGSLGTLGPLSTLTNVSTPSSLNTLLKDESAMRRLSLSKQLNSQSCPILMHTNSPQSNSPRFTGSIKSISYTGSPNLSSGSTNSQSPKGLVTVFVEDYLDNPENNSSTNNTDITDDQIVLHNENDMIFELEMDKK